MADNIDYVDSMHLPASLDALGTLFQRLARACQHAGFTASERLRVELVLEEVFTNTVDHGYANPLEACRHAVSVALRALPGELHITYSDAAKPFNPVTASTPALDLPVAQRRVGGLGLVLLAKMPRHCTYRHENGHNILDMVFACESHS